MSHLKLWFRYGQRNPGRLGFLILSLSISLGGALAATALYAAVSWRELPFVEADSLVKLEARSRDGTPRWWSWPELQAMMLNGGRPFSAIGAYTVADVSMASGEGRPPDALLATMVSPQFFQVLGVSVSTGRVFTDAEHQPGGPRAVLLSHELWQRRYGGDAGVVGRMVDLSMPDYLGEPGGKHLVVGVLAPETWLFWRRFDLVIPFRARSQLLSDPRTRLIEHVIGRPRPHAARSARDLAPVLTTTLREAGGAEATDTVVVEQLRSALYRDLQPKLRLVMAIALVVFLLAGVNVVVAASSAAIERRRETALRLALGAAPRQLARDAGLQVALTVGVGFLLAIVVSDAFIAAILSIVPDQWLARVPGGAGAVHLESIGFGLSLGLVAAWATASAFWTWTQLRRLAVSPLLDVMRHADAPARHRGRAVIVAGEVACCTAVILVATTLGMQLWKLQRVDLGVSAERTSVFWINANAQRYADAALRVTYFDRLLDELRRVPGVEAVGAIDLTFQFDWQTTAVRAGGSSPALTVLDRAATATYLNVSGVQVIEGRWIEPQDRSGGPDVVVVSKSLAEALWPNQRAVGQTIQFNALKISRPMTVVGVVSDIRHAPQAPAARVVYRAVAQSAPSWLYVLVRTSHTLEQTSSVQSTVWRIDAEQPVEGPWPVQEWIAHSTAHVRFLASLTGILAAVAMALAAAGLQALTMYWVETAQRELGIRRALGASHRDVFTWFGRRWAMVLSAAIATGMLMQFALMRMTASQVEAIEPAGLIHLAVGTLAVVAYASAAASMALMRALRIDEKVLLQ